MVQLRSPFTLEVPGHSRRQVSDLLGRGRRLRLSGLRYGVRNDVLRARFIVGPPLSAPLLKTRLVEDEDGTRLVGHIYWGAPIAYPLIVLGIPCLVGLAITAWGLAHHEAWVFALVGVLTALLGAFSVGELRAGVGRDFYEDAFCQALLEQLGSR